MKIVEIVVMLQTVSILMALVSMGAFLDTATISAKYVCAFEQFRSDVHAKKTHTFKFLLKCDFQRPFSD